MNWIGWCWWVCFLHLCLFKFIPPGLPPDITKDEFVQVMSKCGIVMRDPQTEEPKIKLYKDREGNLKGDGLCCYLKVSCTVLYFNGDVTNVTYSRYKLSSDYYLFLLLFLNISFFTIIFLVKSRIFNIILFCFLIERICWTCIKIIGWEWN